MSEDDLRAYQQASNGMLQNAASAAGNWLSDNWEYIAAGAMVAAGVAVMCTGVGGPIGAAMMAGALTSAGGSVWSQKSANGATAPSAPRPASSAAAPPPRPPEPPPA